jgi:hypothetical protein
MLDLGHKIDQAGDAPTTHKVARRTGAGTLATGIRRAAVLNHRTVNTDFWP